MRWYLFVLWAMCCDVTFAQNFYFDLNNPDQRDFKDFLLSKRVVVVGEMHGTSEVPQFLLSVVRLMAEEDRALTVGFEIDRDLQPIMDEFKKTGDLNTLIQNDYFKVQDGRTSEAMGKLFQEIRNVPGVRIICFDATATTPFVRDSLMGINLAELFTTDRMVILTGNLHASLEDGFWKPNFRSAVYHFKRLRNFGDDLLSLNVYMAKGTMWNCMQDGCKERPVYANPNTEKRAGRFVSINNLSTAYSGVVYFDMVTASPPMCR